MEEYIKVKASIKKARLYSMELGFKKMRLAIYTTETGSSVRNMEMVSIPSLMGIVTMVSSRTICHVELASTKVGKTARTSDPGVMGKEMAKAYKYTKMEVDTLETSRMTKDTDMEPWSGKMDQNTRDTGAMMACTVMENSF